MHSGWFKEKGDNVVGIGLEHPSLLWNVSLPEWSIYETYFVHFNKIFLLHINIYYISPNTYCHIMCKSDKQSRNHAFQIVRQSIIIGL